MKTTSCPEAFDPRVADDRQPRSQGTHLMGKEKSEEKRRWGEKRYYSLDYYLKQTFGEKVYKITLNGRHDLSQPGRPLSEAGGCIFCSARGFRRFCG